MFAKKTKESEQEVEQEEVQSIAPKVASATNQQMANTLDILAGNAFAQMSDLITMWAGEKIKQKNIMNQNGANLVYSHGRDIANKLGLSEEEKRAITPFPSVTKISNTETKDEEKGWWSKALPYIGTALLAGGTGAGALALTEKFMSDPIPVKQVDPNVGLTIE